MQSRSSADEIDLTQSVEEDDEDNEDNEEEEESDEVQILSPSISSFSAMNQMIDHLRSIENRGSKTGEGYKDIKHREVDDAMAERIIQHVITMKNVIKKLNLSDNMITTAGALKMFDLLKKSDSDLPSIDLENNPFDVNFVMIVSDLLEHYSSLKQINISNCGITDEGIVTLSNHLAGNKSIKSIDLGKNKGITNASIPVLIKMIETTSLESIGIKYTLISDTKVLLVPLFNSKLKNGNDKIIMRNENICDEDLQNMCEGIKKFGCDLLKLLDLGENHITSEGATLLFNFLKEVEANIINISLSGNLVDNDCMSALGEYIKENKSLKSIRLGNKITNKGIEIISPYFVGDTKFRYLGLAENKGITDKAIPYLLRIIESSHIEKVDIPDTKGTRKRQLAISLELNKMKHGCEAVSLLGSNHSGVVDEDLIRMSDIIKNYPTDKLKAINLGLNDITSDGVIALIESLKNSSANIRVIDLRSNSIDDGCLSAIGEYLQINDSLETLSLGNNNISDVGVSTLSELIIGNTNLKTLDFSNNISITDTSLSCLLEIAQKTCVAGLNVGGTSMAYKSQASLKKSLLVSTDMREVPIQSKTKSAAKMF